MAALVLREDRWRTHHLGASVPVDDVISLCEEVRATLVVITLTNLDIDESSRVLANAVRATGRTPLIGRPGMTLRTLIQQARDTIRPGGQSEPINI